MGRTKIEWATDVWNPIRGCTRVSRGCERCYAERIAARFSGPGRPFEGLAKMTPSGPRWTGEVRLVEDSLDLPIRWRNPRRVFVNSVSDLFHEKVADEWIERIFAVMALARRHVFQVLTKRPERMRRLTNDVMFPRRVEQVARRLRPADPRDEITYPLPNVRLGVSAEDQRAADERVPDLLRTPAAVRFVSAEPLLGPVDLAPYIGQGYRCDVCGHRFRSPAAYPTCPRCDVEAPDPERAPAYATDDPSLDWVIVGAESGPGARPCDLAWVRGIVAQCRAGKIASFVKQLGSAWAKETGARDSKGGDPREWPSDLRVRETPEVRR